MDEDREDFVAARGESNDDEWSGFDSFSSNSATAAAIENTVNSAVIDDEWSGFDSVNSNSATAAASTSVAPVSIEDEVEPVVVVAPSAAIEKTVISTFNNDELIDPSGVEDTISFTDITTSNIVSNFVEAQGDKGRLRSDGDIMNETIMDENDDEWADFETAPVEIDNTNVSVTGLTVADSSAFKSEFNSDNTSSIPSTSALANLNVPTGDESAELSALSKLGVRHNIDTKHYMLIRELIAPVFLPHLSGTANSNGICTNIAPINEIKGSNNISVDLHVNELPKIITDKNTMEYISQVIAKTIPSDALPLSQIEMPVSSHTRKASISLEGLLLTPLNSPRAPSKYDSANKNATNSNDELDITTDFLVSHLATSHSNKTSSGDEYDMSYMETSHSTGSSNSPSRSTNNSTKSNVNGVESHANNAVEAFLKSIPDFSFMLR